MNHGKQPLSTLLWQAFYQHAQRETQINVLFIDSDPAVRLSLCGPVRLVVWAWLLAFFFYVWVCVLMSRCIMDGWKPCWNALSWPKIFGYAAAGLGQACLLEDTHWVAPMSIANVNMGWSLLSSPLEKKKSCSSKQWALDGTVAHLDHLYGCLSQIWQQSQMSWMI